MNSWIKAFRLRTLPLALSSVGMGSFLAAWKGFFDWGIFVGCALTTIFLQILSNLANDYGDSVNGADHLEREGPSRAVQSGEISANQMKQAIVIFILLSLVSGINLLYYSFDSLNAILSFLGMGILCILAAIFYTVGKKPYGYAGLGDISVLIFFGFVGVGACFYLYSKTFDKTIILPSISVGLFATAVLNINNIRDIKSDLKAGKKSIPARIGSKNAKIYHWCLIFIGIGCAITFTLLNYNSPFQFLYILSVPLLLRNCIGVQKEELPEKIDPYLKQMALSSLLFMITFGSGLLMT